MKRPREMGYDRPRSESKIQEEWRGLRRQQPAREKKKLGIQGRLAEGQKWQEILEQPGE